MTAGEWNGSVTLGYEELSNLLVSAAEVGRSAPRDICTTRGDLQRWLRQYPAFSHYVIDPEA